jgi:hypothetical protein
LELRLIGNSETQKLKTLREVSRHVQRFPIKQALKPFVRRADTAAKHVPLILARKLTARDKKEWAGVEWRRVAGAVAEAREPYVEILLQL